MIKNPFYLISTKDSKHICCWFYNCHFGQIYFRLNCKFLLVEFVPRLLRLFWCQPSSFEMPLPLLYCIGPIILGSNKFSLFRLCHCCLLLSVILLLPWVRFFLLVWYEDAAIIHKRRIGLCGWRYRWCRGLWVRWVSLVGCGCVGSYVG